VVTPVKKFTPTVTESQAPTDEATEPGAAVEPARETAQVEPTVAAYQAQSASSMSSPSFSKRLGHLQARLINDPCTDEKWALIERHALEVMSETDLACWNKPDYCGIVFLHDG